MQNIIKIKELAKSRIQEFIDTKNKWYYWHKTYVDWIDDEWQEAKEEIKPNNTVYLEDELWDVFWDYMCLLNSLEQEWLISSQEKVFERCYLKFSERIWAVRKSIPWQDNIWKKIKEKQNLEKAKEHKEKHWN
jgi:NTP pyrophosphatase (non-canonical NTP hydrolase)